MSYGSEQHRAALHSVLAKLEQTQGLLQSAPPSPELLVQVELLLTEAIDDMRALLGIPQWPEPTVKMPDWDTIEEWLWEDGGCEATDGCWVEPDATCPHGHPAWLRKLGLI